MFTEIINEETAIKCVNNSEDRTVIRHNINKTVERNVAHRPINICNNLHVKESKLLNDLHDKLSQHNCIATKDDKGESFVILISFDYIDKVHTSISDINIEEIYSNPSNKYQSLLKSKQYKCKPMLKKYEINFLKIMKPQPPLLKRLPNVYNEGMAVRPLINFTDALSYKLAKKLVQLRR